MHAATILLLTLTLGIAVAELGEVPGSVNHVDSKPRPKRCCPPSQMEGRAAVETDMELKAQGMISIGTFIPRFATDRKRKMYAMEEIVETESGRKSVTIIINLVSRETYVISPKTKTCHKIPMPPGTDSNYCVPEGARYVGRSMLGGARNGLLCDAWQFKFINKTSATPVDIEVMSVLQTDDCIPIFESIKMKVNGTLNSSFMTYMDIKPRVSDPTMFDIPSYCKQAEEGNLDMLSKTARHVISSN